MDINYWALVGQMFVGALILLFIIKSFISWNDLVELEKEHYKLQEDYYQLRCDTYNRISDFDTSLRVEVDRNRVEILQEISNVIENSERQGIEIEKQIDELKQKL